MTLASEQLAALNCVAQSKAGTVTAEAYINRELRQQADTTVLPQRPANPFLTSNYDSVTNNAADAVSTLPTNLKVMLEAALDVTDNDIKNSHPLHVHVGLPPSHTIEIRRSRRNSHLSGCASSEESDDDSMSSAIDRAQDEKMCEMATWRMCKFFLPFCYYLQVSQLSP